jgi:hypothetical protein
METPSLFGTNPTAYAWRTLKCGQMLIVHEGGERRPNKGAKAGSSLDSCERICERSCSLLFVDGEHCLWHEQEPPPVSRIDRLPGSPSAFCFALCTWQRCGMHMRLEVWQSDLQLMFRDLGNSLSNCPRTHHFKRRSLPRAPSALRSLYKQIGYARPQWCSCAIRCFVTVESSHFFPGAYRRTLARMFYELAGYGLVLRRRNFWRGRRGR